MRKEPQRGKIIWSRSHSKQMVELGFSPTQPDSINRAFNHHLLHSMGLPGGASGKEPACQCKRHKRLWLHSWVGKMPWRRAQQPTPVFLPGESRGQKSLLDYSPLGHRESDTPEATWHSTAKETNHSVKNKSIRLNWHKGCFTNVEGKD